MYKGIISLCLFSICCVSHAQENKLTLKQCIETALKENIQVQQSGVQAGAAMISLQQAKDNRLPNVNGNFAYGFNQGRNVDPLTNSYINQQLTSSGVGLGANVLLFNGMRLLNLIKQNEFSGEAAKMDLQQVKDNIMLNVILAFLQVLSNEDVVAINKAQVVVTKKQLERMDILVKEGVNAVYQLTDLKGQLASEEIAGINARNQAEMAKMALCRLMNREYSSDLQLDRTDIQFPLEKQTGKADEVYKDAAQNLAVIKAGELKIKSAAAAVKVARSGFFPTVNLNGSLGSSYSSLAQTLTPSGIAEVPTGSYVIVSGNQVPVLVKQQNYSASKTGYTRQLNNNLGSFIGVNVQVPVFNGFQTRNRVKLAKMNLKTTELDVANIKMQLRQDVQQAYLNMTAAYERSKILLSQVTDFEESFRAADVRFTNGVINAAEYLVAKNNLDNSRISLAQAKYEYAFRAKLLQYYKGEKPW